jgi:glucose/arabinose dehydrogenase
MKIVSGIAALAVLMTTGPALAADAPAGKAVFRTQCALCHSAEAGDNGGAQGPSLVGVLGRPAASAGNFGYTDALKNSKLTWDPQTLHRFLGAPTQVVPGTAMVIPVADATDRDNVIAYFQALKDGTYQEANSQRRAFTPPPPDPNAPPPKGEADWKKDAPGRRHRVDVANLPAPFDTPSSAKFPRFVEKPAGAELKLPAGFKVDVFAKDLQGARAMRIAPNGDVFLAQTLANKVTVLRPSKDGSRPESVTTFAQGLNLPLGMAFHPAKDPKWLYVAETNRIVRYPYSPGATVASALPEVVVPQLYDSKAAGHYTRDLAFSKDGKRMFVSVGSESNVAEQIPAQSVAEAQAFEKAQGVVGAAWGSEANRAAVLVFDAAKPGKPKIYATGIRNCVGLTVQPSNGELWCTVNERDMLGDDLVPDYSTRVKEGGFYGWPWYYMGKYEDPRHAGKRPDLAGKALVPDVPYTAHSAAVSLAFYDATSGASAFPAQYRGEGFAVLHGSWNRAFRTGHKVVRVLMKDGKPTGEYEDFLTGFIVSDGDAWGRPVGIVVAKDGSLLLSDDGGNLVYRISYQGK